MNLENTIEIQEILNRYPREQRCSLAILQEMQKAYGYISVDSLTALSGHVNVPLSDLFSLATFYKSLSLTKKGKFIIKVCDGTACHIRGSITVLEEIKRTLQIKEGETTPDGLFSLEVVNCVGSCAMAPVVICGDEYFGNVKQGESTQMIKEVSQNAK